ncbi:hypothetical protein R3W88_032916 [Solanum pinnatisectum]|uniref:Uncharacterized protein n=1 Tax=Solanum pinnatisectum TaxID=50273 RepID=A0AAV9LU07_9SOLN|nr:hypothetical protein R3W88_032916 [Solanum pinnatisectum]
MASAVTFIMVATISTLCYWVVMHRIESSNLRSRRKSARSSKDVVTVLSNLSKMTGRHLGLAGCRVSRVLGRAALLPKGCDVKFYAILEF